MKQCDFKKDACVIKEGDDGNVLYVVDKGTLDCFKKQKDGSSLKVKTYNEGEAFGELALLYNTPRAASIFAKTDSVCFSLDRTTFNAIVKQSAFVQRKKFEEFLEKVTVFESMEPYERTSLCDC